MFNLSIVIVSFNTKELTLKCLQSIYEKKWKSKIKVWVVDNGSIDGSVELIKKSFPQVDIIESKKNQGFAKGNNIALKKGGARYYLFLNSDTEVKEYALDNLLDFAVNNNYDIASCRLLNIDGSFQPNGGKLPNALSVFLWLSGLDDILKKFTSVFSYHITNEEYYKNNKEIGWVGGTAMLVKGEVFNKIGYLDEKIFMYGEDVEFCLRAKKAGFRIGWTDKAEIAHLGGGSSKLPKYNQWLGEFKGLLYIYNKHYGVIPAFFLKILLYIFIILRVISFSIIGNLSYSKTYAKVLTKI